MKLTNKDQVLLEKTYQQIRETSFGPTAGTASRTHSNPGIHNADGALSKEEDIQKAMELLNQYAKGDITNLQLADHLDEIFNKQGDDLEYDPDVEAKEFQSPDFS